MMRPFGIDVTVFEPFVNNGSDGIDVTFSRRVARDFLSVVASGKAFSSLFLNFVLNSVPFDADRRHILRILNELTGAGKVYVSTKSTSHSNCLNVKNGGYQGGSHASSLGFELDYEPNVTLSELSSNFRTQKFFDPQELCSMLGDFWDVVKPLEIGSELRFVCRRAKKLTDESLESALRFEFDLPYPDGSRMGLADAAIEAFAARRQKRNS